MTETPSPGTITGLPQVPAKPARMSQRRYYDLYDNGPLVVEIPGARFRVAGPLSAAPIAASYARKGIDVTVRPA